MSQKKGLAKLKEDIKNGIADLSSLEVASFAGGDLDLSAVAATKTSSKQKEVFKVINQALLTGKLIGYSKFEVDGDAMNYVNNTLEEDQKYLVEGHAALVEGAQKSRKDFFEFVMKVVRAEEIE